MKNKGRYRITAEQIIEAPSMVAAIDHMRRKFGIKPDIDDVVVGDEQVAFVVKGTLVFKADRVEDEE